MDTCTFPGMVIFYGLLLNWNSITVDILVCNGIQLIDERERADGCDTMEELGLGTADDQFRPECTPGFR